MEQQIPQPPDNLEPQESLEVLDYCHESPPEVDDLVELIDGQDVGALDKFLALLHPADLALLLEILERGRWPKVLARLSISQIANLMEQLPDHLRDELAEHLKQEQLTKVIEELDSDDAADVLAALPESLAEALIRSLAKEDRLEVESLHRYHEDTASGLVVSLLRYHHRRLQSVALCPSCRLLQPAAQTCRACSEKQLVRLGQQRDEYRLSTLGLATRRKQCPPESQGIELPYGLAVLLPALILSGTTFLLSWLGSGVVSVGLGASVCCFTLFVVLGIRFELKPLHAVHRRLLPKEVGYRIVTPARALLSAGAAFQGRVRSLGQMVDSFCEPQARCLICALEVRQQEGRVLFFRTVRNAEVQLIQEDGEQLVICGEVWLEGGQPAQRLDSLDRVNMLLISLGLSPYPRLRLYAEERRLSQGDEVCAYGTAVRESHPSATGTYRSAGTTQILRGKPGSPILIKKVSDRARRLGQIKPIFPSPRK